MITNMTIKFIPAKYFTVSNNRIIDLIVIHDMEAPENVNTAENVAKWFAGSTSPRASTHYNIDSDSETQSVLDKNVAWCAPGANHNGLHFEHAGYARQSREQWLDVYSRMMLHRSAKLTALKASVNHIPVRRLTSAQIKAGLKGFAGHGDINNALHTGTHTDPNPNFPWDVYLKMVVVETSALHPTTVTPKPTSVVATLHIGSTGSRVKALQVGMNKQFPLYSHLATDSHFGPATEKVVKEFQRRTNIEIDGHVGPITVATLKRFGVRV